MPLLIFAAIAFHAARKHTSNLAKINRAEETKIAALQPFNQLVRLEGVIKQVPQLIDGPPEAPLAFVRLKVEVYERDTDMRRDDESGWRSAGDKLRATPFLLEDETGAVWVDPQRLDKVSLGEGSVPTREAEAAAILTDTILTDIGAVTQREGKAVVAKLEDGQHLGTGAGHPRPAGDLLRPALPDQDAGQHGAGGDDRQREKSLAWFTWSKREYQNQFVLFIGWGLR